MKIQNNIIKNIFSNVYFINGTAYAGKSTMVKLLAEKYDGICCGENYHGDLMDLIDIKHQPNLSYFKTMASWQEFITRTPEEYDNWIIGCSYEAADLEIVRLLQLVDQGKKIFVDTNIPLENLKENSKQNEVCFFDEVQQIGNFQKTVDWYNNEHCRSGIKNATVYNQNAFNLFSHCNIIKKQVQRGNYRNRFIGGIWK